MKRFLTAVVISLVSISQIKAERITIDGVVDMTPQQSYREAGGGLQIGIDQYDKNGNPLHSMKYGTIVADPKKIADSNKDFGEDTEIIFDSGAEYINIDKQATKIVLRVLATRFVARLMPTELEIERDPQNPLDHRYRIEVTEYTPGTEGKPGIIKVAIKSL